MNPIDFVIIGVIVAIMGLAGYAIYRAKKAGCKCIGCPDSKTCSRNCAGCSCHCAEK